MRQPALGIMFRCQYAPEALPDYARRAEAAGFDELWVVEDCFYGGGIASASTALACTATLTIGLGILPAVARNPAFTAMEIATLARLYPGRFRPGLGHGVADWMRQIGEMPSSQLNALEAITRAVRALLAGENVTEAGPHVRLDHVRLNHPPRPTPPVYLGVRGPKSLALSGRVADGTIVPECSSPAYVAWARRQIAGSMAQAQRPGPHRLTVLVWCHVDQDGDAARRAVRPLVAAALASGDVGAQLAPTGWAAEVEALLTRGGKRYLEENLPEAWLSQLAVAGTPDECASAIRQLKEAGADAVVLAPSLDQAEAQFSLIVSELLPRMG